MRTTILLLCCTFGAVLLGHAAESLRATDLHCEYQTAPPGLDTPAPRLGWILNSRERGERQGAYRIVVASNEARLANNDADLWDSGRVESSEQNQIAYAGQQLASNQQCFWKVQVWNVQGASGGWSPPSRWTMGLLGPAAWKATWVSAGAWKPGAPLPVFRRLFGVSQPVRRAVVHVSGLGHFDLFLDGKKVGDHFLDPPWSDYRKTVYYTSFDITAALPPGRHAFGIMLGKGFYNTAGDRRVHGVQASGTPQFILQAHLFLEDGTEQVIPSDESWETAPGPITHSAMLGGEDFDARRLPADWAQPQPTPESAPWSRVVLTPAPPGALHAAMSPPMTYHGTFRPARIDEPQPGVFVYDFGQNASAIPRLRVRGTAGQTLRLVPAEQRHGMTPRRNDGRGLVNQAGVGSPNYYQYTLRGVGSETWQPQFTYGGFHFLQVEGAVPAGHPNPDQLPVLEELESVHVRSAAGQVGHFECSNPLFNHIDRIVDWAVRANLAHVLTDCPHREKLGWLEVAYLMGPSIAGRYDVARFYSKVARDCAEAQAPSGMVPTVAPAFPAFAGGFAYTPEWGAAAVVVPWLVHEWYGDRAVLADNYSTMRGFVDYLERTSKDLVPVPGLGDWYDYGHGKPVGPSQFTPVELSAMATFHRCATIVAQTAEILNNSDDEPHYRQLARRIGEAFNARWFNGTNEYRNTGSPQCANSMALVTGMTPTSQETQVLDRVVQDIRARGNQQTAGDIGHWYLLQALGRNGRHDVIFDLVSRTNLGSYGFIVNNGWTSMPEAWDADTGASMNHCMLGHIQEWFLGDVAGIRPDPAGPGFARCLIAPQPVGDLTWAKGSFESVRGRIVSEWKRLDDGFELSLVIPANMTATVAIPGGEASGITEGGRPVTEAPGVRLIESGKDRTLLEVGGGSYFFRQRR